MVNCSGGLFINTDFSWRLVGTQPVVLPNGTTLIQNGASSLTVSKGGYNEFFNAGWGGQTHYYNWGSPANYLAIAIVNGGQYGTRTVVIVDTDAPHGIPTEIVSQVGAPATTPLPILWHCPGAGGAVLVQFMDGQRIGACICTSDTGRAICALPPFRAEGCGFRPSIELPTIVDVSPVEGGHASIHNARFVWENGSRQQTDSAFYVPSGAIF
ncbi:hypothetical protein I312_106400 [Cryptococcus bacillisporus CA1280]|uniref:uncharacterized protein n=1 Tax=Cryptococcus bacillisporus CA1280 TaxID=1296109 RepID=UPI003369A651